MYSEAIRSPSLPFRRRLTVLIILCGVATASRLDAQFDTAIVPHRYIVVYRNAVIPGDAESRVRTTSARVLHRNERFGIAILSSSETDDAAAMRRLATLPNVEAVLHDRTVTASQMTLRPNPILVSAPGTVHVQPTGPAGGHIAESPSSTGPLPTPDAFYNSPQGWAVRQVGGYGNNIPGGPAHGPWDTTMGQHVRIAILDSGVDASHPDIAPNLALNLSEINQDPQTGQPSPCDDGSPQDQSGHGTWTASLAAAAQGLGTGDIVGVAPAASLLNIKVLQRMPDTTSTTGTSLASQCSTGQPGGLLSWVIQGIEDAMANRADVISMSLGTTIDLSTGEGAGLKATFDRITYAASQAGIVLIAAAGNDGYNLGNPRYAEIPAQSRNVLAIVASTNPDCAEDLAPNATCAPGPVTLPYYSNFGAPLNALAAPGGSYPEADGKAASGWIQGACSSGNPATTDGIPSTPSQSYGCFNLGHSPYVQAMGTSASASLAAGVAALLISAHPDWSPAQVIAAMRSSAVRISRLPVGQINAAAALLATP